MNSIIIFFIRRIPSIIIISVSESGIKVFPNPAKDQTTLEIPATFGLETRVEFFEMGSGKLVRQFANITGTKKIDLSDLKAGMYSVRFISDQLITAHKLTVIK